MVQIALIDPKGISAGLNTGLAYIAGSLDNVTVYDFNNYEEKEVNADVVGISIKSFTIDESIRIAKKIKTRNPKCKIICGGAHVSLDYENFLKKYNVFDYAIIGDGEIFKDVITSYKKIHFGFIEDLDSIPFPNYDAWDIKGFPGNVYPLVTSRGCPYNCSYCSVPLINKRKWRARSVENIIEELKTIKLKEFQIYDDNFSVSLKRAKEFCKQVKKLNFKWSCPNGIKATNIDEELVKLMKDSGCYQVNIGIESGVEKVFEEIDKGGTLYDIEKAVKLFKKYKIKVIGFFIIGLPYSTAKLDKESFKFGKKLKIPMIWSYANPYIGTRMYDWIQENGTMLMDWTKGQDFGINPKATFETLDYKAKERIKMYHWCNLRSKSYGAFIDDNSSNFKKAVDILKVIFKYDLLYLPYHLLNLATKVLYTSLT